MGISIAVALHAIPLIVLILRATHPMPAELDDESKAMVSKPVIAASLLKLGKPLDPNKLPDRLVPQKATGPKRDLTASTEDPTKKSDAGTPPLNVDNSDINSLVKKSDAFAEDAGVVRPEIGSPDGVEGGLETDPSKVHAGDMYAAKLGAFFHERWQYPTVISQGEANRLCVVVQFNLNPRMVIWHVSTLPIKASGNQLFDDSAESMLQKLLDDRTSLPEPPPEVADQYKGRTVQVVLSGDLHGDTSRCK
mgnify:CR=1 FL=1